MVYGFMADLSMIQRAARVETQPTETTLGYFTEQMGNFFLNPGQLRDVRTVRIIPEGMASTPILGNMLNFDIDETTENLNDISSTDELKELFNIVDLCVISQGQDVEDLEAIMAAAPATYGVYVPGTLELSTAVTVGTIETVGVPAEDLNIRQYIQFSALLTGVGTVVFKIWVDQTAFLTDYPISNITKVVFPCEPANLLSPSDASIVHAISEASGYIADLAGPEIQNKDHTGTVASAQDYHNAVYTGDSSVSMTFQVYYKGRIPTQSECRAAIITAIELLIDEGIGGEYGTIEDWQELFPGLWITNNWYMIPPWDNTYELDDETLIYSGIHSYANYMTKLIELFPTRTEEELASHIELLKPSTVELILAAVPALDNEILTLKDVSLGHATYQHTPASGDIMSANTQLMKTLLERALAKIMNTSENTTGLTFETIAGHDYWSFTVGPVAFHVLDQT